jgi:hypothetical protein
VRAGEAVESVRAKLAESDIDIPLLVDEEQRPLGWLSQRGLTGERVRPELRSPAEPMVEMDDVLRDALSDLLSLGTRYAPVVDATGAFAGVLSVEVISQSLADGSAIPGSAERPVPRSELLAE